MCVCAFVCVWVYMCACFLVVERGNVCMMCVCVCVVVVDHGEQGDVAPALSSDLYTTYKYKLIPLPPTNGRIAL